MTCFFLFQSSVDGTDPMLSCPSDITDSISSANQTKTVSWTLPTVSDNSGTLPTLTSKPSYPTPSGVFGVGTHGITYTATDGAGNQAFCMFRITVTGKYTITVSLSLL